MERESFLQKELYNTRLERMEFLQRKSTESDMETNMEKTMNFAISVENR